jgi:hypothetical protein
VNGKHNFKYMIVFKGLINDYYIAIAVTFSGMYEFPTKKFYWALSTDFKFTEMPDLND